MRKYCSRHRSTSEHQALLSSTASTETSGSYGKPKRESVLARVKELIPIMKVFFPVTMYWAVSYQRFSSFVLQGVQMDCFLGSIEVPPGN
jgi:dipeptide/tripeptide permease